NAHRAHASEVRTGAHQLADFNHEQDVGFGVAQPEHRRYRIAHAADLCVDIHTCLLELGVHGFDVIGFQTDAGLPAAYFDPALGGWRSERNHRVGAGRSDLDPAIRATERDVGALLQPERSGVEGQRLVDVRHRNHDVRHLADTGRSACHDD